jgi:hypothetical protein
MAGVIQESRKEAQRNGTGYVLPSSLGGEDNGRFDGDRDEAVERLLRWVKRAVESLPAPSLNRLAGACATYLDLVAVQAGRAMAGHPPEGGRRRVLAPLLRDQ